MYPIPATRTATISVRNDRSYDRNDTRDAAYRTAKLKGYVDLLQDTTLEEVLSEPGLGFRQAQIIRNALVNDFFPSGQHDSEDVHFLARWLAQHKQAKLLCLWLESTPLSIVVLTKETAAGLLTIMQSGLCFSGLTLEITADLQTNIAKEVIPLLVRAFQANATLTGIVLFSDDYDSAGLSPLFDVLAEVAGLELVTEGGPLGPADFSMLGKLLSRNKTLQVLALLNLGSGTFDHGKGAPGTGNAAGVIKHVAGQLQLERLELSNIPLRCQAVIGELMCANHVLKKLKIGLDGSKVDTALIDGFSRTSSVEDVCLSVLAFDDDMLTLISRIAHTNVSINSLELRSRYLHENLKDNSGICSLISSSRTLSSLTWQLPTGCKLDLVKIGAALERNIRLETLMLIEQTDSDDGCQPGWINETSISALAKDLIKNRTLTDLVLASKKQRRSPVKTNYSVLQQVLDRNTAYQRYACTDEFVYGAAEGFFAALNMPTDPAILTARALIHYKPRTGAAAVALINRASYAQALFRRRQAHATMLDHLLPITRNLVVNNRKEMIELLYGMIVTRADFSSADLSRIADSPTLPGALVAIMFRSQHDYLYLVRKFCQVIGMYKMRSCVISEIAEDDMLDISELDGTGNDFLLSMLEQSFPPDQGHLLPFVEKELNYGSINSAAAKLFVGYNIPKVHGMLSNKAEIASWCVENRQPGVLIAFYDTCLSKVVIDFEKYPARFARIMMDHIPQLKKSSTLSLKGIPDYQDALVLVRVLAGTSILKELHIDGNHCGQEFDFIMQGSTLNRGITSLSLDLRQVLNPPAICDTLSRLLEANREIRRIFLALHDDDPEQSQLRQLAAMDERLELEQAESMDD
jgi:hypothetical protein